MPTKPKVVTLTNSSVDILNVIRNNASVNYQNYVPVATSSAESIREIGAVIMDNPQLQNEFLNSLVNRIGKVLITSKLYENPWAMFKKGMLEYGETIEEIFVDIAKPFQFDENGAESTVFKREIPDVRSAFHPMNYQKYYKATIQNERLRQAFLSWQGINDLITRIVNSMYTGANYDEFLTMKYLIAKNIINGRLKPITIPAVATENMDTIVTTIKATSNDMTFLKGDYNITGVKNFCEKSDQYVIVNGKFDASMNVNVLATAFNEDKVQFSGRRILVDSFGSLDNERLAILFKDDPTYTEIPTATLQALDEIPALLVDKDWFMIVDNMYNFTEQFNGEGLYWNYWYHVWKTFSVSPFSNCAMFVPGTPSVTSVTVTPSVATVPKGTQLALTANVVTEHFATKSVNWSVPEGAKATVSKGGLVTVSADATEGSTITVTATSVADSTKTDTCVITVA